MKVILRIFALIAPVSIASAASNYPQLPALNLDIRQTSVSGISSGGFMAVQLAVAYSSIIKGVGVVAAGPYYCSQSDIRIATTRCSCTIAPTSACNVTPASASVPALVTFTSRSAANHLIDDPANLRRQRLITFSGAKDGTVPRPVVTQLIGYYSALGAPAQNVSQIELPNAGHTMPTVDYGVPCSATESPFIGKCGYDAAQAILSWIYGPAPLQPPGATTPKGRYVRFDQSRYVPQGQSSFPGSSTGLDSSGWLYVPASCSAGEACRLHVALHGCEQGQDYLPLHSPPGGGLFYGTTFVRHAGYAQWADNNHIVVLYPQAVSIPLSNPYGCWDWWGYTDRHFADQQGIQMRAIRNMIERLTSGTAH